MLWHLTHRDNVPLIRKSRLLLPAERLTHAVPDSPRRGQQFRQYEAVLRDQDVLHESCVQFEDGWTMKDLLSELHRRVFFWSGYPDRPIRPGRRAVDRYRGSDSVIRVPFLDVVKNHLPYFSRCNSGATRMQGGKKVPRGSRTFVLAEDCYFRCSEVVEVTFIESVRLPLTTEVARSIDGPWEPL